MIVEMEKRLARLEAQLNGLVRVGNVTQVLAGGQVRVSFARFGAPALVSAPLPVLFPKTHADQACAMPDVGEQVLCVFLPCGLEQGFVLGAFYSAVDSAPVEGSDKWHLTLSDGSWMEFDRAGGTFDLHANGLVRIVSAEKVEIDGGSATLAGVVTGLSICHFTGHPHGDVSTDVEASKG